MNPRILALVEDLIGPDFVCWGTHYFCKMPHDPKAVPWHQDASYWPFTPARTVTCWLAIDDSSVENACMSVIPGTHRMGHLTWKRTSRRPRCLIEQEIEEIERYVESRPHTEYSMPVKSRLHADMRSCTHGSPPNTSARKPPLRTHDALLPHLRAAQPTRIGAARRCSVAATMRETTGATRSGQPAKTCASRISGSCRSAETEFRLGDQHQGVGNVSESHFLLCVTEGMPHR